MSEPGGFPYGDDAVGGWRVGKAKAGTPNNEKLWRFYFCFGRFPFSQGNGHPAPKKSPRPSLQKGEKTAFRAGCQSAIMKNGFRNQKNQKNRRKAVGGQIPPSGDEKRLSKKPMSAQDSDLESGEISRE